MTDVTKTEKQASEGGPRGISRRTGTMLFLAVISLGVALRYPTVYYLHEAGADASYYAGLVQLVVHYGRAPWTSSLLSYFGLFPFSEGATAALLVGQFQVLTGLPIDVAILTPVMLLTVAAAAGVFLCILRVTRSPIAGSVGAFAFLTAPILLLYSTETLSTRYLAVCLIPFLVLTTIEARRWGPLRAVGIGAVLALLLAATHQSFVLIFALLAGIILLSTIDRVWRRSRRSLLESKPVRLVSRHYHLTFLAVCAVTLVTVAYAAPNTGGAGVGLQGYDLGILSGTSPLDYVVNLGAATIGGVGLAASALSIVAPKRWNLANRPLGLPIMAAVFVASALVVFRLYARPIIAALLSIGAGLGLVAFEGYVAMRGNKLVRQVAVLAVVGLVGASLAFAGYMNEHWASAEGYIVTGSGYSSFTYVAQNTQGNLFCNHYPSDRFLLAYTGRFCSPSLPGSGLEMLPFVSGTLSWSGLVVRAKSPQEVLNGGTSVSFFDVIGYDPYAAYITLAESGLGPQQSALLERYNVSYVLEYRPVQDTIAYRWILDNPESSAFLSSVHQASYLVYQDDSYSLWYP